MHGEGVWLTDADGRRYLDAYAQYGAVVLGHNAPEVRAAVRAALDATACRRWCSRYWPAQAEALGRALAAVAPGHPRRCVFATSGAEAVEAAHQAGARAQRAYAGAGRDRRRTTARRSARCR